MMSPSQPATGLSWVQIVKEDPTINPTSDGGDPHFNPKGIPNLTLQSFQIHIQINM